MKKESNKKSEKKPTKLVKNKFTLIEDVRIGDELVKKGKSVNLTEDGRKYFKSLNYI